MFADWLLRPGRKRTMVSLRRELVYSLLLAIALLVAGMIALLWVANAREQRYQDELSDLRRALLMRNAEIETLHRQLRQVVPDPDSTWSADTVSVLR